MLLAMAIAVVAIEIDLCRRFVSNFEKVTSIKWPRQGKIFPPLFWLSALTGETSAYVTTSAAENERIDMEMRRWEAAPRDYRGGFCEIASDGAVIGIVVFASDTSLIKISYRTGR